MLTSARPASPWAPGIRHVGAVYAKGCRAKGRRTSTRTGHVVHEGKLGEPVEQHVHQRGLHRVHVEEDTGEAFAAARRGQPLRGAAARAGVHDGLQEMAQHDGILEVDAQLRCTPRPAARN